MIGSLGQPLLFLLAFGFGFGSIYQRAEGGNYIQFLAPGIIAMSVLFMAVFSGIELIWDRQFGFLKETMVAPVSRWEIMLGRTLGGATIATMQGLIVFVLTLLAGFRPQTILKSFLALGFVFIIALLFTSLGTAIASLLEDMQGFPIIMNFLVMPIFFFSGALFPLKGLPKVIQLLTTLDPLTYGVDGIREALSHTGVHGMATDFLVLSLVTLFLLGLGVHLFEKIQI